MNPSLRVLAIVPLATVALTVGSADATSSTSRKTDIPTSGGRQRITLPTDQLRLLPKKSATAVGGGTESGATTTATTASPAPAPFLTRPYWDWHAVNSVFDHCMPTGYYSVDGKICEVDGTVALASYGTDPYFSRGYATTPGGSTYLYYDGHNGWDLNLSMDTPVLAAADGTVTFSGWDDPTCHTCSWGQTVLINHGNGFITRYAHLDVLQVSTGQYVARGQQIGLSGTTGNSTGPHLHFGLYRTDLTYTCSCASNGDMVAIDPWGWQATTTDPWPYDEGDLWIGGNPQNPVPSAPTAVAATAVGNAASVTWTPPAFNGGDGITSFTVTASPGGATVTVPGFMDAAWVDGLTAGTAYSFAVTATGSAGTGPASSPSAAVTPQATAVLPNPAGTAWQRLPGAARDIAAAGPQGTAWVVGTQTAPGGYAIYHWSGSGWTQVPGGATAIAADAAGDILVDNSSRQIFFRTGTGWRQLPGLARDVALSASGTPWVVGTATAPGGYGIYWFDGTGWHQVPGGAVRISVDSAGNVWVVNQAGAIYERVGSTWTQAPGAALDVGAGGAGAGWIASADPSQPGATERWAAGAWSAVAGSASEIATDSYGLPWVVSSSGQIFERLP